MAIDPEAEALLAKNEAMMLALRSYAAECWAVSTHEQTTNRKTATTYYRTAELVAVKPNLMRYQVWSISKEAFQSRLVGDKGNPFVFFTSDGKQVTQQFEKTYWSAPYTQQSPLNTLGEPWGGFFRKSQSFKAFLEGIRQKEGKVHNLTLLAATRVDTVLCQVVAYHATSRDDASSTSYRGQLFLGPDGLVRRKRESVKYSNAPGSTHDFIVRNLRTDFPQPNRQTFVYQPPQGVQKRKEIIVSPTHKTAGPLLANGRSAPDFTVIDMNDRPLKLSDFKGKVVVIDFWATNCSPCIKAMPSTNKIARAFKARGVVFLGVNTWEGRHPYRLWTRKNQGRYESILFARDPAGYDGGDIARSLFSVSGIPTQFVIDRSGIVRASFVGFNPDEAPLRMAIEAALRL